MSTEITAEPLHLAQIEEGLLNREYLEDPAPDIETAVGFKDLVANILASGEDRTFVTTLYAPINKAELVGKPFIMRDIKYLEGSFGAYVYVRGVTVDDVMFSFADGSSGIYQQLLESAARYVNEGAQAPRTLYVPNGLRESTYPTDKNGRPIPKGSDEKPKGTATTYYLA